MFLSFFCWLFIFSCALCNEEEWTGSPYDFQCSSRCHNDPASAGQTEQWVMIGWINQWTGVKTFYQVIR